MPADAAARLSEARDRLEDLERRLRRSERADSLVAALGLGPSDRAVLEDVGRRQSEAVAELGRRVKEAFRDSAFGFAAADRVRLDQFAGERKRIDEDAERAVVALVGADRLKQYRQAEREQREKERALRKLTEP